jgi:hypothetical protein
MLTEGRAAELAAELLKDVPGCTLRAIDAEVVGNIDWSRFCEALLAVIEGAAGR